MEVIAKKFSTTDDSAEVVRSKGVGRRAIYIDFTGGLEGVILTIIMIDREKKVWTFINRLITGLRTLKLIPGNFKYTFVKTF